MAVVVQKYGGSSVATPEKIKEVAGRVMALAEKGNKVVVVVSAMGGTTDELLDLAREIDPTPSDRELDMLLSVGERITMSLLCMAIHKLGGRAISLTGSQCGIITNDAHSKARIIEVRPVRVQDELERGSIVVVAGFQGMSYKREITTLGRGGSDTTAVALAAALGADYCEICSDVDGVYTADPDTVKNAMRLDEVGYEVMQEMAESGARVLAADAVEFAKRAGIALYLKSASGGRAGTVVRKVERSSLNRVAGIAHEENLLLVYGERARLGELLEYLDLKGIGGKQVVVFPSDTGSMTAALVISSGTGIPLEVVRNQLDARFGSWLETMADLGAVSLLGEGINQDHGNFRKAMDVLESNGIAIMAADTSRFRITFLVESGKVEESVRLMHRTFIEECDSNDGGFERR